MLEDIWESIVDGFHYFISFEWLGTLWEGITNMFESIGEISFAGLGLGAVGAGLIFALKDYMLTPFTKFMNPAEALFWTITTYVACFLAGYFIGKFMEES